MVALTTFPHVKVAAWEGGHFPAVPLADGAHRRFETDACFVTYRVPGEDRIPRLRKEHVGEVRKLGGKVEIIALALDYDRPGHAAWEDEGEWGDWLATFDAATHDLPFPTLLYSTPHGARIVYVLDEPILPSEAEGAYDALLGLLASRGIECDPSTRDWTRLFRWPAVIRPDLGATWEVPTFDVLVDLDNVLPVELLGDLEEFEDYDPEPEEVDTQRPTVEECDEMLFAARDGQTGRKRCTELFSIAKRVLKSAPRAAWLREAHPTPPSLEHGERNAGLMQAVGTVIKLMVPQMPDVTPRQLYALFARHVELMGGSDDGTPWPEVVWDMVLRVWQRERQQAVTLSTERKAISRQIVKGFREMLRRADSSKSLAELAAEQGLSEEAYVRHWACIDYKGSYYLLDRSGSYRGPFRQMSVISAINTLGLGWWYGSVPQSPGASVTRWWLEESARSCNEAVMRAGVRGAVLEGLDQPERHIRLLLPAYYVREDIQPEFVDEVDQWLHRLVGDDQYSYLAAWISMTLRSLGDPLPAIVLIGAPATGKTFFAQLLGAMFGPGNVVDGATAFGSFNFALTRNPIVSIDEGFQIKPGSRIDEEFRAMTAGQPIEVNQKFLPTMTADVCPRFVLTSNSENVLQSLVGKRDLDGDSIEALRRRLMVFRVQPEAADFLRHIGQRTKDWIKGPRLALRHFAWMAENVVTDVAMQSSTHLQLATAGTSGAGIIDEVAQGTTNAELAKLAIIKAIEHIDNGVGNIKMAASAVDIDGARAAGFVNIYVTPLLDWMGKTFEGTVQYQRVTHITTQGLGRALRALRPLDLRHMEFRDGKRRRFHPVCVQKLIDFALHEGLDVPGLLALSDRDFAGDSTGGHVDESESSS